MSTASKTTPRKMPSEAACGVPEAVAEARDVAMEAADSPTEQRRVERIMTVAESFDDPEAKAGPQTYGPLLGGGAPSLEEAVQRFMRAAHPEASDEGALFHRLLGDGPPMVGRAANGAEAAEEPTAPEELTEEPTEPEELATERSDPPWDALLHISLEAARERSEVSDEAVAEPEEQAPAPSSEVVPPPRVAADERTAAATPAAISGDRSSRRIVRGNSAAAEVEDAEEESFRRDGSALDDDDLDDDSEEILDDRGRLFTPQPVEGDTLDELSQPTPPQGEAYPPPPLRRRATRDETVTPAVRWSHTPSHLALPRIDSELLAERQGLDPAHTAEPITVDGGFDAQAEEEQSTSGATAELLSDNDILTGEFDPVEALDHVELDLRAARRYEPLSSPIKVAEPEPSPPLALAAPPPAPAPAKELPRFEVPEDLVPIASVQVKRLDQPTARGFRLSLEDAPALGRETPRTPLAEAMASAAQPASPQGATSPISAELIELAPPSTLRRHWPIFAGLLVALLTLAALGGLWVYRQHRASRHLDRARRMAAGATHHQLRAALEQARLAATQGGRSAEVVSLAAAAHARLAYEFGESHLGGVASLAEEAKRLGAPYAGRAADDLTLADTYLRLATSSLPQAIERLREVASAHPQDTRLRALYGRLLLRARRFGEAESVLEVLPAEGRWLRLRARLAMARGQSETAQQLWARARADGGATGAQVTLDRLRGQIGDESIGEALFAQAKELAQQKRLSRRERAWAQLVAASAAQKRAHWKEARAYLARALKVEPLADPAFHALAAQTALRAGEPRRAREQAERALQLMPEQAEILGLRAKVALALDDEVHARALLARCGASCLQRKRLLEAEAALLRGALERAATILLGSSVKGGLHHRLLKARLHLARGQHRLARHELSALAVEGGEARGDERVWSLRGVSALEAGRLGTARKALQRAVALHPFYAEAHWALGRLHTRQGDAAEARQAFARAVAANPYTRRTRLDLGRLLLRLGRFSAALKHFEAVLRRDGQDLAALAGRARCRVELSVLAAAEDIKRLRARGHRNTALLLGARLEMRRRQYARALRLFGRIDDAWLAARGRALVWRALSAAQRSDDRAALRQLESLAAWGQGAEAQIGEKLVRSAALLARGELAFGDKATKKALALGTAALRSLPPRFRPVDLVQRIRLLKARCHEVLGAVGAAISELKEITDLDRQNVPANQRLGELLLSQGKVESAAQHLALAQKARPYDRRLRTLLTRACAVAGEHSTECRAR